jgi:carboxyl-terminal processing protease
LTTARYYTPSGRSIQAEGIKPDIELRSLEVAEVEKSIEPLKEADLSRHLQNGNGDATKQDAKKDDEKGAETLAHDDYQLYEALNMLKGLVIQQERMQ